MDDRGEVSKLQKGHGEWNDSMSMVSVHVLSYIYNYRVILVLNGSPTAISRNIKFAHTCMGYMALTVHLRPSNYSIGQTRLKHVP